MKLAVLTKDLMNIPYDVDIPALWDDSRRVTKGSLCAIFSSLDQKAENFIKEACVRQAKVILALPNVVERVKNLYPEVLFLVSSDPKRTFKEFVYRFYGDSSADVRVIGVTGTNGKTTITFFLEALLKTVGFNSAVIGTVNCRVGDRVILTKNTTPGFLDNQIFLSDLKKDKVPYALMEVSSHALDQGRVDLIDFKGGIFTNLTGDHLDYHQTMEKYFEAKSLLFKGLKTHAYAVINVDDMWGKKLLPLVKARVFQYGIDQPADIRAIMKTFRLDGMTFDIKYPKGSVEIKTCFTGKHNVYNILSVFAVGLAEGFSPEVIKKGIESLKNVPGRLERVAVDQKFSVFIDYAHTDDGLRNVLLALKQVPHRKLIVVFGAGGDRDKTKRPRMAEVASLLADEIIITSDNPRTEDPQAILKDIVAGMKKEPYYVVEDRREAIGVALKMAQENDIVLLAGKGHETYQVLKDKTIDFIERDIVKEFLQ